MFICKKIHNVETIPKTKYLIKLDTFSPRQSILATLRKNRPALTDASAGNSDESKVANLLDGKTDKCVQLIKTQIKNLVDPIDGYLCDIYNISCNSTDWLTGWEISKILYSKIISSDRNSTDTILGKRDSFKLCGYLGLTSSDFINGLLCHMSSSNICDGRDIMYKYFIYGDKMKLSIDEETTKINYIDTVDIDDLTYASPSICRYIHNYIRTDKDFIYLNFSIVESFDKNKKLEHCVDIKNALHTIMHLNKDHGMCIVSLPWFVSIKNTDDSESIDLSIQMYIYTLSCIFAEIQLIWFIWDDRIWAVCYQKKEYLNKVKYTNLINSDGFAWKKIKKNYIEDYTRVSEDIMSFHEEIKNTKNKILCKVIDSSVDKTFEPDSPLVSGKTVWLDKETIIRQWLHENEKKLHLIKKN